MLTRKKHILKTSLNNLRYQKGRFASKFLKILSPLRPLSSSKNAKGTEASKFINTIFANTQADSYLEIGVASGSTIEAVKLKKRIAVDPDPKFLRFAGKGVITFKETSDSFFEKYSGDRFDAIYLDGLHHFYQTYHDLRNAVEHIKPDGVILIDDVVPIDQYSAIIPQESALEARLKHAGSLNPAWHGDVFRLILLLNSLTPNFIFGTVAFPKNPKAFLICSDGNWSSFREFTHKELKVVEQIALKSLFTFEPSVIIPNVFNPMSVDAALSLIARVRSKFTVP